MHEITRLIADAQAGKTLSPTLFASALQQDLSALEANAGVERNTARLNPHSEGLQRYMRASLLVIRSLIREPPEPGAALFCFRNFPVRQFSVKTVYAQRLSPIPVPPIGMRGVCISDGS